MDITITPRHLRGEVIVIPSKSQAHRLLICAAFADAPTQLICSETNRDIEATIDCLRALGARIEYEGNSITVLGFDPTLTRPSKARGLEVIKKQPTRQNHDRITTKNTEKTVPSRLSS